MITELPVRIDTIEDALAALRAGRPVLVVDDPGRENEGDVILSAAHATPEWIAWTVRHTSGVLCAPMPAERADALELPPMVADNQDPRRTAYTVSVDARAGIGTGISAADRATTLRLLAAGPTRPDDLVRPGHVFPLRARPGGVLERAGHTEAAVDLCRAAGLPPVGVIAEVVDDTGAATRLPGLRALADAHGLPLVTIADLAAYRRRPPATRNRCRSPRPGCSGSPRRPCPPGTGRSGRSATATWSPARATSPWSAASRPRAARSSGCTPNA